MNDTNGARPARDIPTRTIDRALIHPDPRQPRRDADDELREDLRVRGQLDPITVRPHPEILTEWMIVNGERRWRSAEGVLSSLRCQIRKDMDSRPERLMTQLSHNLGKPLAPLEEARAFKEIIDDTGLSVATLAEQTGRPKSTIGERLALLEIGPWLELVESGDLPLSHAVKVLVPLRTAADSAHEHALAFVKKDYRWDRAGKGTGISLGDFERIVEQAYLPSMYPLTKTKSYGKQPEIPAAQLAQHDAECDCGGIVFEVGHGAARRCCGNPTWWRPLQRKALAAKKKPKGSTSHAGRAATKELYLPKGTPVVKSDYGTPTGVVQLTDANGKWAFDYNAPFDPSVLPLEHLKLVQWRSTGASYPCVGTKDTKVIAAARKVFAEQIDDSVSGEAEKLERAVQHARAKYLVTGPGAPLALAYVLVDLALKGEDEEWTQVQDAGTLIGVVVPAEPGKLDDLDDAQKWVGKLTAAQAGDFLTALFTIRAPNLKGTESARVVAIDRAAATIAKREIPWKTKPKEEKAAPPKKVAKKAPGRAVTRDFMKAMYASPALAVVIGAQPVTRVDVTKKLWAYIKRKGLQDKKNRRNINADDALRPVFGGKTVVSMFEMTKMVNKHLAGTAAAAALIGTSAKKKGALANLSTETAALPGILDDDDDGHVEPARAEKDDDGEDDLWDDDREDELDDQLEGVEA